MNLSKHFSTTFGCLSSGKAAKKARLALSATSLQGSHLPSQSGVKISSKYFANDFLNLEKKTICVLNAASRTAFSTSNFVSEENK